MSESIEQVLGNYLQGNTSRTTLDGSEWAGLCASAESLQSVFQNVLIARAKNLLPAALKRRDQDVDTSDAAGYRHDPETRRLVQQDVDGLNEFFDRMGISVVNKVKRPLRFGPTFQGLCIGLFDEHGGEVGIASLQAVAGKLWSSGEFDILPQQEVRVRSGNSKTMLADRAR